MSQNQKRMVDQFEWARASMLMNKGMYYLTYILRKQDVIKDVVKQYDENEKTQMIRQNDYNQRFAVFREVPFPRFKNYEMYQEQMTKDIAELSDEDLYEQAKNYLLHAKQILSNLE